MTAISPGRKEHENKLEILGLTETNLAVAPVSVHRIWGVGGSSMPAQGLLTGLTHVHAPGLITFKWRCTISR